MEFLMKHNKVDKVIQSFIENADIYGNSILKGSSTEANKAYKKIVTAKDYIVSLNQLELLAKFLNSNSISVQIWAARYLLFSSVFSNQSQCILQAIAENEKNLLGTIAEQTLKEWESGNLKLEY